MRKLYLILLLSALTFGVKAQSVLRFTTTQYNLGSVVNNTPFLTIADTIYNVGSVPFSGNVVYYARINSSTPFATDSSDFSSNPLDTNGSLNSRRLDTISIPYGGNNAFVSGPNGVVIWPLYSGGHAGASDSIRVTVTKTFLAGIDEAPLAKVYIIQHGTELNIHFEDMGNLVQQVSLYDLSGKQIYTGAVDQSQHISTNGWGQGVYICEITTIHGERRTIKFILQ